MTDDYPLPPLPPRAVSRGVLDVVRPDWKAGHLLDRGGGRPLRNAGGLQRNGHSLYTLSLDLPKARELAMVLYEELTTHGKFTKDDQS